MANSTSPETKATTKETKATTKPQQSAKAEKKVDYWDEKVPVFLPQPEGDASNARTVTHNGINYQIQYNKEVMVPRKIKAILDESAQNKAIADAEMNRLAGYHELGTV